MKTIFIKDERLREIHHDLNTKITDLLTSGKLKGSYTIKESTRKVITKKWPGYAVHYGWEIIDYNDKWKIDDLDNFEIKIKKDNKYYLATCEQIFTENVIMPLMGCGETVEGALLDFLKELRAQKKTLCVRGKAIEGDVVEAIYEKGEIANENI